MSLLDANLAALRRRHPGIAERLARARPSGRLTFARARSGATVPLLRTSDRPIALHSLFDPEREATRLYNALTSSPGHASAARTRDTPGTRLGLDAGDHYLLFEGLGGGYQLVPFLSSLQVHHVLVLETDAGLLKDLLAGIDLTTILSDPRVHLLLDPAPSEIRGHLRESYLPAFMGGFLSVPLRPRIQGSSTFFDSARRSIRAALDETARDYSVQAAFGRLWTRNILVNLATINERQLRRPPRIEEAIVTSAGPSLDERIDDLRRLRSGRFLLATDTSLPALLARGEVPDGVLTIDAQNLGYHHYLFGLPPSTLLFAEIAAPPSVVRLAEALVPVCGGHPLARLVASRFPVLPTIDTSGGNVGHAAVSLAVGLGATRVYLFGADYSYPYGKPYAYGTYLYSYFAERALRTRPAEHGFSALLYRDPSLRSEPIAGGFRYTTDTLLAYRDHLRSVFASSKAVTPIAGYGLDLGLDPPHPGLPPSDAPSSVRPSVDAPPSEFPPSEGRSVDAPLNSVPPTDDPAVDAPPFWGPPGAAPPHRFPASRRIPGTGLTETAFGNGRSDSRGSSIQSAELSAFLSRYRSAVETLSWIEEPPVRTIAGTGTPQLDPGKVLASLYPVAAHILAGSAVHPPAEELIERAKGFVLGMMEKLQ